MRFFFINLRASSIDKEDNLSEILSKLLKSISLFDEIILLAKSFKYSPGYKSSSFGKGSLNFISLILKYTDLVKFIIWFP